jgi:L-fuconolactonase
MTFIDSQVHAYEANTPKRPWHSVPNWPDHVTGDEMVAAMDKVGVHGAIFISAFSMYRYDASYAVEVQRAHPNRMAIVKPVDPDDPAVADVIAHWKSMPGAVGIRVMLTKESKREPNDPGLDRILRAAVRNDFPVNILCWGNLNAGTALIDRHPNTRFIIDHLGIMQPRMPPAPSQPWVDLRRAPSRAPPPTRSVRRGLRRTSGLSAIAPSRSTCSTRLQTEGCRTRSTNSSCLNNRSTLALAVVPDRLGKMACDSQGDRAPDRPDSRGPSGHWRFV